MPGLTSAVRHFSRVFGKDVLLNEDGCWHHEHRTPCLTMKATILQSASTVLRCSLEARSQLQVIPAQHKHTAAGLPGSSSTGSCPFAPQRISPMMSLRGNEAGAASWLSVHVSHSPLQLTVIVTAAPGSDVYLFTVPHSCPLPSCISGFAAERLLWLAAGNENFTAQRSGPCMLATRDCQPPGALILAAAHRTRRQCEPVQLLRRH
jgi:hypothetical protein